MVDKPAVRHALATSLLIWNLAFACAFARSAMAEPPACSSGIRDTSVANGPDTTIPIEKILTIPHSSLAPALAFDFKNAVVVKDGYSADVSIDLITDLAACPGIRFPLGVVYRGALVVSETPTAIRLTPGNGVGNVGWVPELFNAALAAAVPLPAGFTYDGSQTAIPADRIDGTVFSIDVVGPPPIGVLYTLKWQLQEDQPDFGLRDAFGPILGGAGPASLDAGRVAALKAVQSAIHATVDAALSSRHFSSGAVGVTGMHVDWSRWDRGDRVLFAKIEWPQTEPTLLPMFPASAEVRFEPSGEPRFSLPPLNIEKLRDVLAEQVAARLPDPSMLDQIATRFGDLTARSIPAGWLRVRNASLSATELSAEIAFAIDPQSTLMTWSPIRFNLPARGGTLEPAVARIASAAGTAIKDYLSTAAVRAAYDAVIKYVDDNRGRSRSLFGTDFSIEISKGTSSDLPPKPLVTLRSQTTGVTITGVGMSVTGGIPSFDWSTAHIDGAEKLAERLVTASAFTGGDLSLSIGEVSFSGGRLSGRILGNLLGNDFSVGFSIGETDTKVSLPSVRAALIRAIQSAVSGREMSYAGLSLSNLRVCPDGTNAGTCAGDEIGLSADFAFERAFSGTLDLTVYKNLKLEIRSINSSSGFFALTNLFSTGVVSFNIPPKQFSPLVISGTITVPPIYGVITVPPIPFEWSSATKRVTLSHPTSIPVDTDIPIGVWLNLSQVIIPVSKDQDGSITVGAKITIGEHYVQYVFNIDGRMKGDPGAKTVEVTGLAFFVMLPLYTVHGKIDFDQMEMESTAKTDGLVRAVIPQDSDLHVYGKKCLVMQKDKVKFLFFEMADSLIIQIPADACGHDIPPEAKDCGLTAAGGMCIGGDVHAGSIADGKANIKAGLDLKFGIDAKVSVDILVVSVDVAFQGDEHVLQVIARVPKFGVQFGFAIAEPKANSDDNIKNVLTDVISQLAKLNFRLPAQLNPSSDGHGNSVTVDVSESDREGPSTPLVGPSTTAATPNSGNVPASDTVTASSSAPATEQPAAPPPAAPAVQTLGASDTRPLDAGPIRITFDAANHLVQYDTHSKLPPRTSTEAVRPDTVNVIRNGCGTFRWLASDTGRAVDAVDADAVVIAVSGGSCRPPPVCVAGQFCALALRAEAKVPAAAVNPNAPWLPVQGIIQRTHRANPTEIEIIDQTARVNLTGAGDQVPVDGAWSCLEMRDDGCGVAIETGGKNDGRAYIAEGGSLVPLDRSSFLYAESSLGADENAKQLRLRLFSAAGQHSLRVYGHSGAAWFVDDRGTGQAVGAVVIKELDSAVIPVTIRAVTQEASFLPSEKVPSYADPVLERVTGLISETDRKPWSIDDLGIVMGKRRIVVRSQTDVYLVTEDAGPPRHRAVAEITARSCLPAPQGTDLDTWLHTALSTPRSGWSGLMEASGVHSLANPEFLLFADQCGRRR